MSFSNLILFFILKTFTQVLFLIDVCVNGEIILRHDKMFIINFIVIRFWVTWIWNNKCYSYPFLSYVNWNNLPWVQVVEVVNVDVTTWYFNVHLHAKLHFEFWKKILSVFGIKVLLKIEFGNSSLWSQIHKCLLWIFFSNIASVKLSVYGKCF